MNLCMKESFSSDLSQLAVDVLPNAEVFLIPGVGQGTIRPIRPLAPYSCRTQPGESALLGWQSRGIKEALLELGVR